MSISSLLFKGLKRGVWVWDDNINDLHFDSLVEEKKAKKQKEMKCSLAINGLTYAVLKVDLKFKSKVSELELMDFRHFLKQRNQGRVESIVTLQDCKTVAIFLCIQQLPSVFLKFYDLMSVNRLLRACIVYIQFYLKTCEKIVKTQQYLRADTPGHTSTYDALQEDLEDLRVLVGRFYSEIMFVESNFEDISITDEFIICECFFKVSAVVIWIALERKYFNIIKVELERIFRSAYFNNCNKDVKDNLFRAIKKENHVILDENVGMVDKRKSRAPSRLKANSPIIIDFLHTKEPNLMLIGRPDSDVPEDDRLKFLTQYIFLPETEIQKHGLSIGILGLHRRLFDPLLYPCPKRILKLLITGSPMDISEDRKQLRESAVKKAQRESEPQSPHIFDDLPTIPRRKQSGKEDTPQPSEMASEVIEEDEDDHDDDDDYDYDDEYEEDEDENENENENSTENEN